MFKAGPAPASIAPVTLEGGKYKFKITRAQQGEGWFSFMMSVVDVIEGQQSEVGLQSLIPVQSLKICRRETKLSRK